MFVSGSVCKVHFLFHNSISCSSSVLRTEQGGYKEKHPLAGRHTSGTSVLSYDALFTDIHCRQYIFLIKSKRKKLKLHVNFIMKG